MRASRWERCIRDSASDVVTEMIDAAEAVLA
jgi:hypothetical protein